MMPEGTLARHERGITLLEVALMLTVSMAILAALAPVLSATIRDARMTAATMATSEIATQITTALSEWNYDNFTTDGERNGPVAELLVGDGDIPRDLSATGSNLWQRAVNDTTGLYDFLERHLVTNNPGGNTANAYDPPGSNEWRGAYLDAPVDPDPWGNRYAVNAQYLGLTGSNSRYVVVLSVGPDEQVDSQWNSTTNPAADDDIVAVIET